MDKLMIDEAKNSSSEEKQKQLCIGGKLVQEFNNS